jgi:CO/xanthine dehydrogenase Mo-binding subunit
LKAALAEEMDWPEAQIHLAEGVFRQANQQIAFEEAARIAVTANGGPLELLATYAKDHSEQETFIAQVAEVEVDPETGAFQVLHFVTAHDTGTLINPIGAEGQIEGGLVQGLGFATMEELRIVDGQVANASFGDYKIPCIADVPPLEMVLLQDASGPGPWNAKSLGEHSLIPPAAAIANAIYDAVGVRMTSTPITAEKVYAALIERSRSREAAVPRL